MGEFKKLKKKLKKARYFGTRQYSIEKVYSVGTHGKRLTQTIISTYRPRGSYGQIKIMSSSENKNSITIELIDFHVHNTLINSYAYISIEDADEAFKLIKEFSETKNPDKLMKLFEKLHKKYRYGRRE